MSGTDPGLVMVAGFVHGLLDQAEDTVGAPHNIEPVIVDGFATGELEATIYDHRVRVAVTDAATLDIAPTSLPVALAVKLASLVVHAQEMTEHAHGAVHGTAEIEPGDFAAISAAAFDPDVTAWLDQFAPGLLPEKRDA